MTDLEKEFRVVKLKVGILSYVSTAQIGYRYLNSVRSNFAWAADDEFNEVVAQLLADGLLCERPGRDGGRRLWKVKPENAELQKEAVND